MRGGSNGEDINDNSTADDFTANEGNDSTIEGDDNGDTDAPKTQGLKEKPTPREIAAGHRSRTNTAAWKAKEAKIAKMAAAKAKAAAAKKKAAAPLPKKFVPKRHWSCYTGRGEHHALGCMIANTLQLCCNTSNAATIKLLWEG